MDLCLDERALARRVPRLQAQRVPLPLGAQRPPQDHVGRADRLRAVHVLDPDEAAVLARRPEGVISTILASPLCFALQLQGDIMLVKLSWIWLHSSSGW